MISTNGLLTVADVAKRLGLSTEQVRRKLREGKLEGQRVGNQWFVEEAALNRRAQDDRLIPRELLDEIAALRERIFRRNGVVFDVVEILRHDRESR